MDINGQNYFSPHPIPILNTQQNLLGFLKTQPRTFAILKKSGYEYLTKNYALALSVSVLKVAGRNYVLKIEPVKPTK